MAIEEYDIVRGTDLDELERKVNEQTTNGFQPYGPAQYHSEQRIFWQTMVAESAPDPEPEA